jgi:hypothetical protein
MMFHYTVWYSVGLLCHGSNQAEIDKWVQKYNTSQRRANKRKILPKGIPDVIHQKPERFGSQNFQVEPFLIYSPDIANDM